MFLVKTINESKQTLYSLKQDYFLIYLKPNGRIKEIVSIFNKLCTQLYSLVILARRKIGIPEVKKYKYFFILGWHTRYDP